MKKATLIGENNPYGADPRMALYCEPRGSAGGRLCHDVLGLTKKQYVRDYDRRNLLQAPKWSAPEARRRAEALLWEIDRSIPIVLLGQRVQEAFLGKRAGNPFTFCRHVFAGEELTFVQLPHPSGRCRAWSEPGAFERAREVMRAAGAL